MITTHELAAACIQLVENFESSNEAHADCIAIMYGTDPRSQLVLVFPLSLADIVSKQGEPDIVSILNPAEYDEEIELSLPEEIKSRLPRGEDLQKMVQDMVVQLRRDMPDRLIYMTDPECSELTDSVREAQLPPALAWLSSRL